MENTKKILALFDFDGTLIKGDSIVAYLRTAKRLHAISRGEYIKSSLYALKYKMGKITEEAAKEKALAFRQRLEGRRRLALDAFFASDELIPRVYPEGKKQVEYHRQQGHLVLLVSASTNNYMDIVATLLPADGLICTRISDEGRIEKNCKGKEKVQMIQEYLQRKGIDADFENSYAYGDSKSDLPMLKLCGHPTLVNPKASLKKAVGNMPILQWKGK